MSSACLNILLTRPILERLLWYELGHAGMLGSGSPLSGAILRKFASLDSLGKLTALEMLLGCAACQASPVQELRLLSSCLQARFWNQTMLLAGIGQNWASRISA